MMEIRSFSDLSTITGQIFSCNETSAHACSGGIYSNTLLGALIAISDFLNRLHKLSVSLVTVSYAKKDFVTHFLQLGAIQTLIISAPTHTTGQNFWSPTTATPKVLCSPNSLPAPIRRFCTIWPLKSSIDTSALQDAGTILHYAIRRPWDGPRE